MFGAIVGDTIGSVYEFHNTKDYNFRLFTEGSSYTDDTIMSVAVASWLLKDTQHTHQALEDEMVRIGKQFPYPVGGYGGGFQTWLFCPQALRDYKGMAGSAVYRSETGRHPYFSYGNGAGMRASAVGWFFDTLGETEEVAKISAEITHNHPEGIKGAQATAAAIWMARNGMDKYEIRSYIESRFGYDLHRTWEQLHPVYDWDSSCQGTVPEAIIAFIDSIDFEDAIRKAVSLGGDSDTLACITGGIAEAYYREIPDRIIDAVLARLPEGFKDILEQMKQRTAYGSVRCESDADWQNRITPERITELREGQSFCFGSNLGGCHGGGAARIAFERFGAEWGVGVGPTGNCYAIPTMQGPVQTIKPYVDGFIEYAKTHSETTFLMTRIGCGIAGFRDEEIAPLFREARNIQNIWLPESFWKVILK